MTKLIQFARTQNSNIPYMANQFLIVISSLHLPYTAVENTGDTIVTNHPIIEHVMLATC